MVPWPQSVRPADAHNSIPNQNLPRRSDDACSSQQAIIRTSSEHSTSQLLGPQQFPTIRRPCQLRRRAHSKPAPGSSLSSTNPSSTPNSHQLCSVLQGEVLQADNVRLQAQPSIQKSFTLRTNKMEERLMRRRKREARVSANVLMKPALDGLQALEERLQCATQAQKRLVQATLRQWKQAGRP